MGSTPRGLKSRAEANLSAIEILQTVATQDRPATGDEQTVIARWSGWGGLGGLFDETKPEWEPQRGRAQILLGEDYKAARAGVLNAHYTHPAYVEAIWKAVEDLGISSGSVLEPGCGSGTFIGLAPQAVSMTGIEVDPISAQIASALYPDATILARGYETMPITGDYDAAVGNVPFGNIRLYDETGNQGKHTIHNHFIIKSLDQIKPGGIVAFLTSRYTLDATNPAARRDMYERADLLGALRLPTGAHRQMANTEAVTDLLVFRKRKDTETPTVFDWEHATPMLLPGGATKGETVANYFQDRPDDVLGRMFVGHGMYNSDTVQVEGETGENLATQLSGRLERIVENAKAEGLGAAPEAGAPQRIVLAPAGNHQVGHIRFADDQFKILSPNGWSPLKVPSTQSAWLQSLLDLRDQTRGLLELEASNRADTPALSSARALLADIYTTHVGNFGPINQVKKTSRLRPDGSESVTTRRPPVMKLFNQDPFAPLTRAIERFDEDTDTASPSALLTRRQVLARYTPKGAENVEDALTICLETMGSVDVDHIAWLVGQTPKQARDGLQGLVFDKGDGELVTRAEYTSGNVRQKLQQAESLAAESPTFQANVEALKAVMPPDLGIREIVPALGAPWITPSDHQYFAWHLFRSKNMKVTYIPGGGWRVSGGKSGSAEQSGRWGTKAMSGSKILKALLNNSEIKVTRKDEDNNDIFDPAATNAAGAKAEEIETEFARWIWSNPERSERLIQEYNNRFNSLVPRTYDNAGSGLRLPGLALTFNLHPHQKAAIARMVAEPATGLFHDVGAGKTLEMVCGVMEQKRLGLISKPMIVVPNHMLGQFEREWLQAYPGAKVLAAESEDIGSRTGRGDFMAKVVTGDWDAVICTVSAFKKIGVTPKTYGDWAAKEMRQLETWIASAAPEDRISVRAAETTLANLKAKTDAQRAKHKKDSDSGVTFEDLGVDYLVVDEAHTYKNLAQPTHLRGIIAGEPSGLATDLDMKIEWLRKTHGQRVLTFATATPIANTMGEMWVMNHYLRPDLLQDAGLETFDQWAATFTAKTRKVEVNTSGEVKVLTRIAKFKNLPELMTMWGVFADVKTREQLALNTPDLVAGADGERSPQVISVDIGPAMVEFNGQLLRRAEAIRARSVERYEDNNLNLSTDGRAMAIDQRLITGPRRERALSEVNTDEIEHQKVDVLADEIIRRWDKTKEFTYRDDLGELSPTPGSLQLVFCDQGTPKSDRWSLYQELKDQLIKRGMPKAQIAFAHDGKTAVDKDRIFARARTGTISVLVGSTGKMGTGANMQARAIALHHLDAPWRPADLRQRDGRIIRQGNQNPEVEILRYVTDKSFDSYMWQTLERKAAFIDQIMSGGFVGRDAEDISDDEASYAQVKAIASGNPLILEEARLQNDVSTYQGRASAHESEQQFLTFKHTQSTQTLRNLQSQVKVFATVAPKVTSTKGDQFRANLNGISYTSRSDTASALAVWAQSNRTVLQGAWHGNQPTPIYDLPELNLEIGGLSYKLLSAPKHKANLGRNSPEGRFLAVIIELAVPSHAGYDPGVTLTLEDLVTAQTGTIIRLENHVAGVALSPERLKAKIKATQDEIVYLADQLGRENPWTPKLTTSKSELHAVRQAMADSESGQQTLPTMAKSSGSMRPGRQPEQSDISQNNRIRSIFDATKPGLEQQQTNTTLHLGATPPKNQLSIKSNTL